MKHFLLVLMLLLFSVSGFGQNMKNQEAILQKCVDLPELQTHFPKGDDDKYVAVHIMQYPIVFPEEINITKFGKAPVFMTRHEIYDNNIEAYFLFKKIEHSDDQAFTDFSFYYDYNSAQQKVMHVMLELSKREDSWMITKSDIQYY